jgi:LuxR family maltose regulon positive regulatory protein
MLQKLYKSNLFIVPIIEDGAWYRYHRLFLELLRQRLRLQKTLSAEELHLKASEWYEKNGFMDASIHHTLAGSHWERAVKQISSQSDNLLKNGRISTLLLWLKKIPTDFYDSSADFCLIYVWPLLLSGQLDEAASYISRAEKAAGGDPEVIGQIAATQAYLAQAKGSTEELVQYSEMALSLLPADDDSSRGIVALNLGIAYWHAGKMESAEEPLKEAIPAAHRSGNTYVEISARLFSARVAAVHGKLQKAAEITRALVAIRRGIPIENLALTDLAMYHYEWGEFEKAREYIDSALEKFQRGSVVKFTLAGLMIKIRILIAQGKMHEAEPLIEQCKSYVSNPAMSEQMRSRWAALNVELALHKGNIKEAKGWLEKNTRQLDAHPFYRFLHLAPIRIQLAENEFVKAREMLAHAHKEAHDHKWDYGMVWLLSHMAVTDESEQRALKYLNTALDIGYDGILLRTFIEAGPKLLPHLRKLAARYEHPEYIGEIIEAIEIENKADSPLSGNQKLSVREVEVLRLVTAGLTNRQIAEQLVISISTVKSHIHHICTKLDAINRTQAAAKARELGIIG